MEGEPGIFPDPIARMLRWPSRLFARRSADRRGEPVIGDGPPRVGPGPVSTGPTWIPGDRWDPGNPENRERTRALQSQLRGRLLEWDLIGVADTPEAWDEYDCMLSPLMHQLHDGVDEEQLCRWLKHEVEDHFGVASDVDREGALAAWLVVWWRDATTS